MPEVMERLDYYGERQGQAHVYRSEQGHVAMRIEGQQAFDSDGRLICRNSLDLVVYMRRENEDVADFTHNHALAWLRDEFGEQRAAAAYTVRQEQAVLGLFERTREERARRPADPDRGPDPNPGGRDSYDRGDGGPSFGR